MQEVLIVETFLLSIKGQGAIHRVHRINTALMTLMDSCIVGMYFSSYFIFVTSLIITSLYISNIFDQFTIDKKRKERKDLLKKIMTTMKILKI